MIITEKSAINATVAHEKTTKKYKHINTRAVVESFEKHGWFISNYRESRTQKYQGYQTHVVTMSHMDDSLTKVGDSRLRILIVNNHHASKAVQIKLGLFRLVCSNGLVVEDSNIEHLKLRHIGEGLDAQISEFIDKITVAAEKLREKVVSLQQRQMDMNESRLFARNALTSRFKEEEITEDMVGAVLQFKRPEDSDMSAWSVFNRVQENLIRGFRSADRERAIRKISSVQKDMNINTHLWQLIAA